jgi:imidazole glycerol-phosphate synthase subunit HisH
MIVVIDYGMGNLASVVNAIKRYATDVLVSADPKVIANADKLVLPGVGAFKDACDEIEKRGLREGILRFIGSGRYFLGICLGLQLLFTKSYEDGEHKGFNVIKGDVKPFATGKGLKVPHMGWNRIACGLRINQDNGPIGMGAGKVHRALSGACPLMDGVTAAAYMYFAHSYYVIPEDRSLIAATTDYGITFCSMIQKENIYALQFHPEKSQAQGLRIIDNFVRL